MSRGYLLSLPALALFTGLLILPLVMTLVLSFNVFDYQVGVKADEWTFAHYLSLFSDSYFYEIFWRTFWIRAGGVLLSTNSPTLASGRTKSGMFCSAKLGTSGKRRERLGETTPRALTLPALI